MRLSALLGRPVVSESGERLGRVHDVRGELVNGHLRVTGLVAGKMGLLERYGVAGGGSSGPADAKCHDHRVIPWNRVVRVARQVVVRTEEPDSGTG